MNKKNVVRTTRPKTIHQNTSLADVHHLNLNGFSDIAAYGLISQTNMDVQELLAS